MNKVICDRCHGSIPKDGWYKVSSFKVGGNDEMGFNATQKDEDLCSGCHAMYRKFLKGRLTHLALYLEREGL